LRGLNRLLAFYKKNKGKPAAVSENITVPLPTENALIEETSTTVVSEKSDMV